MNNNLLDIWELNSLWSLLSSINGGDKLCIRGNSVTIEKSTPTLGIRRTYYGDKREDVFPFIRNLLHFTQVHFNENNHIKYGVESFKINIISGLMGLLNLRETYKNDVSFLTNFKSIMEQISKLYEYFPNDVPNDESDDINRPEYSSNISEYMLLLEVRKKIFNNTPAFGPIKSPII
jgi:hypothetical protein